MQLHPLKKLTIVIESTIRTLLLKKICELGATGYTCREVQGYGSRGARSDQFASNFEVEVICPEQVATRILTYVSHHLYDKYACIAWVSDVQVVRGNRYDDTPGS